MFDFANVDVIKYEILLSRMTDCGGMDRTNFLCILLLDAPPPPPERWCHHSGIRPWGHFSERCPVSSAHVPLRHLSSPVSSSLSLSLLHALSHWIWTVTLVCQVILLWRPPLHVVLISLPLCHWVNTETNTPCIRAGYLSALKPRVTEPLQRSTCDPNFRLGCQTSSISWMFHWHITSTYYTGRDARISGWSGKAL